MISCKVKRSKYFSFFNSKIYSILKFRLLVEEEPAGFRPIICGYFVWLRNILQTVSIAYKCVRSEKSCSWGNFLFLQESAPAFCCCRAHSISLKLTHMQKFLPGHVKHHYQRNTRIFQSKRLSILKIKPTRFN